MNDKKFRVRFEQEDGKGEIVNEKGVELTAREVVDYLNKLEKNNEKLIQFINKGRRLSVKELMNNANENESLKNKIKELEKYNEQLEQNIKDKNKYQKVLESKIIRLKKELRKCANNWKQEIIKSGKLEEEIELLKKI